MQSDKNKGNKIAIVLASTGTTIAGLASTAVNTASADDSKITDLLNQILSPENATSNYGKNRQSGTINNSENKQIETDSKKQENQVSKPSKERNNHNGTYINLAEQKPEQKQEGIFSKIKNGITSAASYVVKGIKTAATGTATLTEKLWTNTDFGGKLGIATLTSLAAMDVYAYALSKTEWAKQHPHGFGSYGELVENTVIYNITGGILGLFNLRQGWKPKENKSTNKNDSNKEVKANLSFSDIWSKCKYLPATILGCVGSACCGYAVCCLQSHDSLEDIRDLPYKYAYYDNIVPVKTAKELAKQMDEMLFTSAKDYKRIGDVAKAIFATCATILTLLIPFHMSN